MSLISSRYGWLFASDYRTSVALLALVIASVDVFSPVLAHHPDGRAPITNDVVVADVFTEDNSRLRDLRENHQLLTYIWKDGKAVILTDRDRLPSDAVINSQMTQQFVYPKILPSRGATIPGFSCYRTVEQTYTDLQQLADDNPNLATWIDYGDSWEKVQGAGGYDMFALKLTNASISGPKPALVIMAAMHAREYTTAETATRFAEFLVSQYATNADVRWLLDFFEIHVLPHQNPDGRKEAESGLLWRKNKNNDFCTGSNLRGVDLNRNSTNMFFTNGSNNACGETYKGPEPSSEFETIAVENYLANVFPPHPGGSIGSTAPPDSTDGIFISIHSSGQYIFYPWEGSNANTGNEVEYRALAQKLAFYNGHAACQNCCLSTASGTTVDHAYEYFGVASLTYELGTSFFQNCTTFENSIWPENLQSLLAAAKAARLPYQTPFGPDITSLQVQDLAGSVSIQAVADDTRYNNDRPGCASGEPLQSAQSIADVRYTIGEPPWNAVQSFPFSADDGAFDETSEAVSTTLNAGQVPGGEQIVFVYARDANGNQGPPSAVFINLDGIFVDGLEDMP